MTASYPLPFLSNKCPGSIESSVSVSGQPKKTEGMKSKKVWVIDMDVINVTRYIEGK